MWSGSNNMHLFILLIFSHKRVLLERARLNECPEKDILRLLYNSSQERTSWRKQIVLNLSYLGYKIFQSFHLSSDQFKTNREKVT